MVRSLLLMAVALVAVSGCGGSTHVASTEYGEELLRSGEYDQAIGVLTEAIRIEPHNANAYLYRGRAYQCRNGAGDLDNAINDFTTATELDPKNHEAYYSRSIAYRDRGAAAQSEEDAARSAADHDKARKLDASLAETYQAMPKFTTTVEPAAPAPAAAESVTEKKPVQRESLSDARRRIEAAAAAAAADQGGEPSTGDASSFGTGSSRRYSSDSAARARNSAHQNGAARDDSDTKGSTGGSSIVDRITRNRASTSNRIPTNPLSNVPPTLDPLSPPSSNSTAAPLTPLGGNAQTPHRGGTLPPVASSPYVAPTPYGSPQSSPYGLPPSSPYGSPPSSQSLAPGALQGAASTYDSASPYRTPYQSPFVRSGPAPTGIVPSQTLPPTTGTQQPRPYVTPIPGRINFPATTRSGQYNP
jgi:Tfp pilus assembly protein PilF